MEFPTTVQQNNPLLNYVFLGKNSIHQITFVWPHSILYIVYSCGYLCSIEVVLGKCIKFLWKMFENCSMEEKRNREWNKYFNHSFEMIWRMLVLRLELPFTKGSYLFIVWILWMTNLIYRLKFTYVTYILYVFAAPNNIKNKREWEREREKTITVAKFNLLISFEISNGQNRS